MEAHSGGIDGPLIRELLSFSKTFATTSKGTRVLGQEFISNVAGLNFGKSEKYPLVATAIMETNLACPAHKVVDGVCRLLVPNNVSLFYSKGNRALVKEAEQLMADSRNLVESMGFDKAMVMKAQGLLNVRCMCFIAKKGKELEGKTFAAIKDIAQAFINDLEKITNSKVLNPWAAKDSSSQPEAAAEKVAVQMPHTLEQLKDPKFQCLEAGFVSGATIVNKNDKGNTLYKICAINEQHAKLEKVTQDPNPKTTTANYVDLLNDWRLYKGKVMQTMEGFNWESNKCCPLESKAWAIDVAKGTCNIALRALYS